MYEALKRTSGKAPQVFINRWYESIQPFKTEGAAAPEAGADIDFNHNDFFRSSAEHSESRMVRRLFSLTDIFDSWRTGQRAGGKPRAASLNEVILYTSLAFCAHCSGVMSLNDANLDFAHKNYGSKSEERY